MGLQIADAVASSYFNALESNRFGYTEPRYAEMLRKVAYTHKGSALGYGLKLWPRESMDLIESDEKLAWIKKMYK